MLCDHAVHRRLQLFRIERDQSSERDDEEYGRYVPYDWDLDRQSWTRLGTARLAIFIASSTWLCVAGVSRLGEVVVG